MFYTLDQPPLRDFHRDAFLSTQVSLETEGFDLWDTSLLDFPAQPSIECAHKNNSAQLTHKKGRPSNPVPRHKRMPHLTAELRRRGKIQRAFAELEKLVPGINRRSVGQHSKSAKLSKVSEHCQRLVAESRTRAEEAVRLRQEIDLLSRQIQDRQALLPAAGVQRVDKPPCQLDNMLDSYVRSRIYHNWKFWIFSLLVRPLFASYNTSVSTATVSEFSQSVCLWVDRILNMYYLQPAITVLLDQVLKRTPIATQPYAMAQVIFGKFFHMGPNS